MGKLMGFPAKNFMTDLIHIITGGFLGGMMAQYAEELSYSTPADPEKATVSIAAGIGIGVIASLIPNLDNNRDLTDSLSPMSWIGKYILHLGHATRHRRFMHSLPFALIMSFLFFLWGWGRSPLYFWIPFCSMMLHYFLDMYNEFGVCLVPLPIWDVRYDFECREQTLMSNFYNPQIGFTHWAGGNTLFDSNLLDDMPRSNSRRNYIKLWQKKRWVTFKGKRTYGVINLPYSRRNFPLSVILTIVFSIVVWFVVCPLVIR